MSIDPSALFPPKKLSGSRVIIVLGKHLRFERVSGEGRGFCRQSGSEMNIFRLAGDLSHVLSIFILLLRLVAKKQANGKPLSRFSHVFLGVSLSRALFELS